MPARLLDAGRSLIEGCPTMSTEAAGRIFPPETMSAARVHQFGDPTVIVLEQIPVPTPGQGEVLVEVKAAGVGPWDAWIRAGKSVLPQPLPLTLGSDLSGVVAGVSPGVTAFALGEPVFGVTNPRFTGAYAEYALAAEGMIAPKPSSLTDAQAASVPVVAVTAWQALFDEAHLRTARGCSFMALPATSAPMPCSSRGLRAFIRRRRLGGTTSTTFAAWAPTSSSTCSRSGSKNTPRTSTP